MVGPEAVENIDLSQRIIEDVEWVAQLVQRELFLDGAISEMRRDALNCLHIEQVDNHEIFVAVRNQNRSSDEIFRDKSMRAMESEAVKDALARRIAVTQTKLSELVIGKAVTITTLDSTLAISETYLSGGVSGTGRQEAGDLRSSASGLIRAIDVRNNCVVLSPQRLTRASFNRGRYKSPILDDVTGKPIVAIDFRDQEWRDTSSRRPIFSFFSRV